jgi:hypothetical protein
LQRHYVRFHGYPSGSKNPIFSPSSLLAPPKRHRSSLAPRIVHQDVQNNSLRVNLPSIRLKTRVQSSSSTRNHFSSGNSFRERIAPLYTEQ